MTTPWLAFAYACIGVVVLLMAVILWAVWQSRGLHDMDGLE